MEAVLSDVSQLNNMPPSVDITKPIANWFKPCNEKIEPLKTKAAVIERNVSPVRKCKSIIGCTTGVVRGFEYCSKHILEDKNSPFQRCSYISKTDYKRCRNSIPTSNEKRSYCKHHEKEMGKRSDVKKPKPKSKSKHSPDSIEKASKKRPSTLPVAVVPEESSKDTKASSSEEEFSFFTDTVQVEKTECLWLGNQASDAESTDSEDENNLNHAGVWTLEESVRMLKEKMMRIRHLYTLQFKRLNHQLKEERRKMLKDYDMDSFALSKVGFNGCRDNSFEKFAEDIYLTNYQKFDGPELIAEKLREKRIKGFPLYAKKNDLPRCLFNLDGHRCSNKALPASKFCFSHVCNDPDQILFISCNFKYPNGKSCGESASLFSSSCNLHGSFFKNCFEKSYELFQTGKNRRESRKRKLEREKAIAKRSSARLKEVSSTSVSPTSGNTKTNSNINTQLKDEKTLQEKAGNQNKLKESLESKNDQNDKEGLSGIKIESSDVTIVHSTDSVKPTSREGCKDTKLTMGKSESLSTGSVVLPTSESDDLTTCKLASSSII